MRHLFENVVEKCIGFGFVGGTDVAVDGSTIEADADQNAPLGPKKKPPKYLSETDPEAAWSLKDGSGRFRYETNYLIDTDHGIIVDVEAIPARLSQEFIATKTMLERSAKRHDFRPDRIAADRSYGTGPFLA